VYKRQAYTAAPEILGDFGGNIGKLNVDNYFRYLSEDVNPHVDANYRTKPEREREQEQEQEQEQEHTSVMGSSVGGLISLCAISECPEVFGAAGMVSTHFPLADGALVTHFSERLPAPKTHRLYFVYGTRTLDHSAFRLYSKGHEFLC